MSERKEMIRKVVQEVEKVSSNKKDFYRRVIKQLEEPVPIEELGEVFDEENAPVSSDDSVFKTYRRWFEKGGDAVILEMEGEKFIYDEFPNQSSDEQESSAEEGKEVENIEKLVPKDIPPYVERNLVNGNKDIPTLEKVYRARPEGHPQNVLMKGPTGSGKTHAVKKVAEELEIPMVRVNLNKMTTVEDFVGQWVPDEEDGGFKWQDGILPRLMKSGGVLVVDELNAAPPEILFVLHSVLDYREITLTQKDGEVIKANSDFWVVGAMNPDYRGTQKLNEALKDRFELVLKYPYSEKIENKIVDDDNLVSLAEKLRKMMKSPTEDIRTPCSTRMLIQFERNRKLYGYDLAKQSFINKFEKEERKPVEEAMDMHLN